MEAGGVELLMQKLEKFFYRVRSLLMVLYLHIHRECVCPCRRTERCSHISLLHNSLLTLSALNFLLISGKSALQKAKILKLLLGNVHQVPKVFTLHCNPKSGFSVPIRAGMSAYIR